MCQRRAFGELEGLGDPSRGEWREWGGTFHLRRRLSFTEELRVGPALDIRGTPEARERVAMLPGTVRRYLPEHVLREEMGSG
jgi:hypothetical protein